MPKGLKGPTAWLRTRSLGLAIICNASHVFRFAMGASKGSARFVFLREQERLRNEARLDTFIESKADDSSRLKKITTFRDYLSKMNSDSCEQDPIFRAADNLVRRLQ